MPMGPAIKYAEASRFSELAKPLGPEEAQPFMIAMHPGLTILHIYGRYMPCYAWAGTYCCGMVCAEEENVPDASSPAGAAAIHHEESEGAGLTELDFEPVPESELRTSLMGHEGVEGGAAAASAAATVAAAAVATASAASAMPKADTMGADGGEVEAAAKRELRVDVPEVEAAAVGTADAAGATSAAAAAATTTTTAIQVVSPTQGSPKAPDEKLNKFVDFLAGDNPGACMFHAQMRLSLEGCRKLSNFVGSSTRVKALSLSHNHIGDDGLR